MQRFIKYKNNHRKRYTDYQKAIQRNKQRNLIVKTAKEEKQQKNRR